MPITVGSDPAWLWVSQSVPLWCQLGEAARVSEWDSCHVFIACYVVVADAEGLGVAAPVTPVLSPFVLSPAEAGATRVWSISCQTVLG